MDSQFLRTDIQVLRAVAIIFVVAYHFDLPGFGNGFLGVDVFFIISGYLMAQVYRVGEKKSFLIKRAKRLLPAYFLTILITVFVSLLVVESSDFTQVLSQAQSSIFLIPNFYFWGQDSYFSDSNFNPLLHLWSLGVEFQFYLLVPLVAFLHKRKRVLVILGVSSAIACFVILTISPKTSFFLLPFRMWEFIFGFIAFGFSRTPSSSKISKTFSRVAFLLVMLIIAFYPSNGFSLSIVDGHPGLASLLIAILTSYILLSNVTLPHNRITFLLCKIGDKSYSIYLAHFPILALFFYSPFGGTNLGGRDFSNFLVVGILLLLTTLLMNRFIEERYRYRRFSRREILLIFTVLLIVNPVANILKVRTYSPIERNISAGYFDRDTYRCGKLYRVLHPTDLICRISPLNTGVKILLLGNSHADSIKSSFSDSASRYNATTHFWVKNDPLMNSPENVVKAVDIILHKEIEIVFLQYSSGAVEEKTLFEFIQILSDNNVKVVILGPTPTWPFSIPEQMWLTKSSQLPTSLNQSYEQFRQINSEEFDKLLRLSKIFGLPFFDLASQICTPNCQIASTRGLPYFWDEGHLTLSGAKLLEPILIKAIIEGQFRGDPVAPLAKRLATSD
jgi:peptidoglycan/LPS O-acetylase OafA/YrhL